MKGFLIAGWLALLAFVAWEFVVAHDLPAKYGSLSPAAFRVADILIGVLALLSIFYLTKKF